jgi:hypothetical protein
LRKRFLLRELRGRETIWRTGAGAPVDALALVDFLAGVTAFAAGFAAGAFAAGLALAVSFSSRNGETGALPGALT